MIIGTASNTVISPNFLVRKFCGKEQFLHANRPKLCGNCAFPQNIQTRILGEIKVFDEEREKIFCRVFSQMYTRFEKQRRHLYEI